MTLVAGLSRNGFAAHRCMRLRFIIGFTIPAVAGNAAHFAVNGFSKFFITQNYFLPALQRRDGAASAFTFG